MCRHVAYVGSPVALADALWRAPHALVHQARTPRHQVSGNENPDGWGVAWYPPGSATPQRYRTATRMWDDESFADTVTGVHPPAFLAAARLASPGAPVETTGNAPFVAGPWAFSLNGSVDHFTAGVGDELRAGLTPARRDAIEGHADTEVLFAMVLDRLDRGLPAPEALADAVRHVRQRTTGRLNCILHDGTTMLATTVGNSHFARAGWIASEPLDDDPAWRVVPECTVVTVTAAGEPAVEGL